MLAKREITSGFISTCRSLSWSMVKCANVVGTDAGITLCFTRTSWAFLHPRWYSPASFSDVRIVASEMWNPKRWIPRSHVSARSASSLIRRSAQSRPRRADKLLNGSSVTLCSAPDGACRPRPFLGATGYRCGEILYERTSKPRHYSRASFLSTASAARSPASQAPPTVPHKVSCTASPANQSRSRSGSASALRAHWPPGAAAEAAPRTQGSLFQRVACVRLTACFTAEALVREIVAVLENGESGHQPRRQGRMTGLVGVDRPELLLQEPPVDRP